MSNTIIITRMVRETVKVSREVAKRYIVEAKLWPHHKPEVLDLYCRSSSRGFIERVSTISLPEDFAGWDRNAEDFEVRLLEYARDHLPSGVTLS
jgi:hypothetical protein